LCKQANADRKNTGDPCGSGLAREAPGTDLERPKEPPP